MTNKGYEQAIEKALKLIDNARIHATVQGDKDRSATVRWPVHNWDAHSGTLSACEDILESLQDLIASDKASKKR